MSTSLRFWKKRLGYFYRSLWLVSVVFQIWRFLDDEGQIKKWRGIVSSFEGKLVTMIKEVNDRFDGYSISPKFRKSLLQLG